MADLRGASSSCSDITFFYGMHCTVDFFTTFWRLDWEKLKKIGRPLFCTLSFSAKRKHVNKKPGNHMVTQADLAENFHVLLHFSQPLFEALIIFSVSCAE